MITPEQHAEIRRLYYGEHWKVGTIIAALSLHHETVQAAINDTGTVRRGTCRPTPLDIRGCAPCACTRWCAIAGVWASLRPVRRVDVSDRRDMRFFFSILRPRSGVTTNKRVFNAWAMDLTLARSALGLCCLSCPPRGFQVPVSFSELLLDDHY